MAGDPDGTLVDWRDIATEHEWDTLLLGNGMSINIWEPFGYRNLYDHARSGGLTAQDRKLFSRTRNFERVLADLLTAIRVNDAVGVESKLLLERYRSIQRSLAHAVREVHLRLSQVPLGTRKAISNVMEQFEWVFTTSYDLLVYWAMAADGFDPFMDHFRFGGRHEFDPSRARVPADRVPVYFLHGALHLVVGESGVTWKLTQTNLESLLNQFGKPIKGDATARPLLVTEGSAEDKLAAIEDNVYLSHARDRLVERDLPVVVFGSDLSEHDNHLVEALSANPERPVAISMLPAPKRTLLVKQADICDRLEAGPPIFFDARSHPLGDPGLAVVVGP
jgi:Domain of unknown function (DUF4917)